MLTKSQLMQMGMKFQIFKNIKRIPEPHWPGGKWRGLNLDDE